MRQKIGLFFCIILLIELLFIPLKAQASDFGDSGVDVVIVVDTSGSMKSTDPERIAIEAANLFIDMIEMSESKIGLVSFSSKLGTIIELTDINSISDKKDLKGSIDQLPYDGDTDMGLALQKGYELLQSGADDGNQKAILFLTDGKIDLGDSKTRSDENSYNDTQDVVNKAASDGIPIYTIGLNSDGNVDEDMLSDIAKNTSGRSYLVDSVDNLPEIFDEIFADFINSNIIPLGDFETNGKDFTDIPFSISNNSVLEANIIMISKEKLQKMELIDPSGSNVALNSDSAFVSESNQYTLLKLITPAMGDWKFRIKGADGCKVHVNLIFNYKVNLVCELKLVSNDTGTFIQVTSWLEKEGEKLTDKSLYATFTGEAFCIASKGDTTYPMTNEGDSFTTQIPIGSQTGDFDVYTRIDSDSIYRISDTTTISVTNNAPVFTNLPDSVDIKGLVGTFAKEEIVLPNYVSDPEGDEITYSAVTDQAGVDIASTKVKDNKLIIKGGKSGTTTVEVTATDIHGASTTATITVNEKTVLPNVWPILLILVLVIALVITLLKVQKMMKEKNRIFYGNLKWIVVGNRNREQVYPLDYERGVLPLSKMILDSSLNELGIGKVTIHMNKRLDGIEVKNNSKNCIMVLGFGGAPQTKIELLSGEFAMLSGKCAGNDITVKITFSLF